MKSMTGFGRGSAEADGVRIQVEMGSVNRKNLDVQTSLPRGMAFLETTCQKMVGEHCLRGRVQIRVQVEALSSITSSIDRTRLRSALQELNAFASEEGLAPVASVESLLDVPGVWKEDEAEDVELIPPVLARALDLAVQEMVTMREQEGQHLQEALQQMLDQVSVLVQEAEGLAEQARQDTESRIKHAVEAVAEVGPEVEQRMLQEIALLLEKGDVQEEIDRLAGHVHHFAEKMKDEGSIGRGLDFLCQEMAREWHTLSVKTPHKGLNQVALRGKEEIERLREQVQNVE